ncbi:N-acetylmuramoyl-L-alanine amidase [Paenibacillus yanchengensis]|uniref:N-acetylmuramoyl-L-alanine amidase n=1 Tax=Paenibacillus yanchengensis TaxID=2035833 RepID=A0ABW4YLG2_9BACL
MKKLIQTKRINNIDVDYVIADPAINDIGISFKIGATVKELGQQAAATVAANFNYADNATGTPIGLVVDGGKTVIGNIAKTAARDELFAMPNGTLHIGKAPMGAVWAVQGSPRLLHNKINIIAETVKRDQTGNDIWQSKAYRLAVGLTADNKLVIVRTKQIVSLNALASIMTSLGCIDALNGDGGGSAYLWPSDNGWGRKMGVALTVTKGEDKVSKHIGDANPKLIIDAGHAGADPGASGNGIVEKHMVLDISLYQYKRFKELGVPVALTRDNDKTLQPNQRTTIVKNSGAKHCISNHINAASSTTASGAELIHSVHSNGKWAKMMADSLAAAGQVLRPKVTYSKTASNGQDYYFMHRQTGNVETVIVEYGFLTNSVDAKRLKDNWQSYAEAIVKAYCLYIGHKYVAPKAIKPASDSVDVVVNGKLLDQQGVLIDNVTYVPVRAVADALGASVKWEQVTKTVFISK